jgi:hypothetical protein
LPLNCFLPHNHTTAVPPFWLCVLFSHLYLFDCCVAAHDELSWRWAGARESVELGTLVDRLSSIARCCACRSLVVAPFVAQVAALFAQRALTSGYEQRPGRESSSAEAAGGRPQWCGRIRRSGGCGRREGAAPGGPMVNGVKGERLRKGRHSGRWAEAWEGVGFVGPGGRSRNIYGGALAAGGVVSLYTFPREGSHFPAGKQK